MTEVSANPQQGMQWVAIREPGIEPNCWHRSKQTHCRVGLHYTQGKRLSFPLQSLQIYPLAGYNALTLGMTAGGGQDSAGRAYAEILSLL